MRTSMEVRNVFLSLWVGYSSEIIQIYKTHFLLDPCEPAWRYVMYFYHFGSVIPLKSYKLTKDLFLLDLDICKQQTCPPNSIFPMVLYVLTMFFIRRTARTSTETHGSAAAQRVLVDHTGQEVYCGRSTYSRLA